MPAGPRYKVTGGVTVCEDCGVVVAVPEAHTRFHSILSAHAWVLGVLKTSHIAARIHDDYDGIQDRIHGKKFDSWSADAPAEVLSTLPPEGS